MGIILQVEIYIDKLVLDGIASGNENSIVWRLERELGRQFAEGGILPALRQSAEIGQLDGGTITMNAKGSTLGTHIAKAIYSGMKGPVNNQAKAGIE
jgi:hypothetical protein